MSAEMTGPEGLQRERELPAPWANGHLPEVADQLGAPTGVKDDDSPCEGAALPGGE